MYFGVSVKAAKYNNVGHTSKSSEEIASEVLKLPFSTTPLSFDAPLRGTPREYPHKPYATRNYRSLG